MKCARRHARGDQLQRCRQRVAFCLICILYMIVYKKNYFFQISVFLKELICETYFKIYSIGSYMLPKYIGLNNVKTLNHPLKSDRSRNMWMRFGQLDCLRVFSYNMRSSRHFQQTKPITLDSSDLNDHFDNLFKSV